MLLRLLEYSKSSLSYILSVFGLVIIMPLYIPLKINIKINFSQTLDFTITVCFWSNFSEWDKSLKRASGYSMLDILHCVWRCLKCWVKNDSALSTLGIDCFGCIFVMATKSHMLMCASAWVQICISILYLKLL